MPGYRKVLEGLPGWYVAAVLIGAWELVWLILVLHADGMKRPAGFLVGAVALPLAFYFYFRFLRWLGSFDAVARAVRIGEVGFVRLLCALVCLAGLWLTSEAVVTGFRWLVPAEEEGLVRYSDCRRVIRLKERPASDFYKTYTCTYARDPSDRHIVDGECVSISEPFFGSGCETAKVYDVDERKPKR